MAVLSGSFQISKHLTAVAVLVEIDLGGVGTVLLVVGRVGAFEHGFALDGGEVGPGLVFAGGLHLNEY
jgi:hypothetical protein